MKINISLETEIVKTLDALAQSHGLDRSDLISYLVSKYKNFRPYGDTWEKLHSAILSLTSDAEDWQRIGYAYISIHTLNNKDFPEHLQNEYNKLIDIVQKYNNSDFQSRKKTDSPFDGLFFFASQNMTEDEKRECCHLFVSLYDNITRYQFD